MQVLYLPNQPTLIPYYPCFGYICAGLPLPGYVAYPLSHAVFKPEIPSRIWNFPQWLLSTGTPGFYQGKLLAHSAPPPLVY